jgi:hypothetical protein
MGPNPDDRDPVGAGPHPIPQMAFGSWPLKVVGLLMVQLGSGPSATSGFLAGSVNSASMCFYFIR